jgi:pilus assembly protein CpaE
LTPQYSTANALQNFKRLDSNYLSTLLTKHSSGLSVLAAPDKYTHVDQRSGGAAADVTRQTSTMS